MAIKILGIETSCDETSAAIVTSDKQILSHQIYSQLTEHQKYGGVVPELAARSHLHHLPLIIERTFNEANLTLKDMDAIAVTAGPGLIGGVMVGVMMTKAMSVASGIPVIAVNHLEAHVLAVRLNHKVDFPFLTLLISGGHGQFLLCKRLGDYQILGHAIDDAAGEAFDKVAKMIGLGYPGGPLIEKAALLGDPKRFSFPRPLAGRKDCNLSFAGLKTAVRQAVEKLGSLSSQDKADIAASFQKAVVDCLVDRTHQAISMSQDSRIKNFIVSGGVAANTMIRQALQGAVHQHGLQLLAPPPSLCTDNGAMIAWTGVERFHLGHFATMDFPAKPRWPLDQL